MQFHHICIQTDQYKESLEFYVDILGFKLIKETPDFHSRQYNSWLEQDGFFIELQTNKAGEEAVAFNGRSRGIVHFCLAVDDIEQEYCRIRDSGYNHFKKKAGRDIYEVEDGRLFKLIAPEGTVIEIRDMTRIV